VCELRAQVVTSVRVCVVAFETCVINYRVSCACSHCDYCVSQELGP
jgi:hypothetical protein